MPCNHKFSKYLNLEKIDFVPTTLIVGTFNPGWDNLGNQAEWFYGRTHDEYGYQNNNFWDVLPRLYGQPSLINSNVKEWKSFCSTYKIAITDIIKNIEDANINNNNHVELMTGFADDDIASNFYDFEFVNLVRILRNNPSIENVYITRSMQGFWKKSLWQLINYCGAKNITLKPILTPSGFAYLQQGKYNKANPNNQLSLPDYILMRWREVWHQIN